MLTSFTLDTQRALLTLTSHQRQCVLLHFVDGYTQAEIATRYGVSQPDIAKIIRTAGYKIRPYLAPYGLDAERRSGRDRNAESHGPVRLLGAAQ